MTTQSLAIIDQTESRLPAFSITDNGIAIAAELLRTSLQVAKVDNPEELDQAGEACSAIRRHIVAVEADRKALTAPLLDAQRLLKRTADEHCAPLISQQQRIEYLVTGFNQRERERVALENQARQAEIDRLAEAQRKAEADAAKARGVKAQIAAEQRAEELKQQAAAVITAPLPAVSKSSGGTFATGRVLCFEVTDISALYAARPDLCFEPSAKPSAIKATCDPSRPVPGLRLWFEDKTHSRAR